MTPAILSSATAPANIKAMPAAQPQSTVIAIQTASTAAMIAPRLTQPLEVCPPPERVASRIAHTPGSVNPIGCAKTAICRPDRLYAPHRRKRARPMLCSSRRYHDDETDKKGKTRANHHLPKVTSVEPSRVPSRDCEVQVSGLSLRTLAQAGELAEELSRRLPRLVVGLPPRLSGWQCSEGRRRAGRSGTARGSAPRR